MPINVAGTRAPLLAAVLLAGALFPAGPAAAGVPALALAECGPRVTDPLVEPPQALTRLRPDLAWPLSTGTGITVAVVDSGVSAQHPTLVGKVVPGADYVLAGRGVGDCDENGHGTLVAGIIAGREATSAGFRFHGVAPGATVVPVRVLRDQTRSFEDDLSERIATAIRFVVDERSADVINLSLTTPPTPQLEAAVRYALDRRVVVVAAAGNEGETGSSGLPYPAAYPGVLAVAGVDANDGHVSSSTEGEFVDVAAPGNRIAGPSPRGGGYLFAAEGGTSFATAYVSGVAALIRGYDPGLTPEQVARRITETADHPAQLWNPQVGHGVVNPARAVGALRGGGDVAVAAPERIEPPLPRAEPQRAVRRAAAWIAGIGVSTVLLVLLIVPVLRRGRRRGWRSGPVEPTATRVRGAGHEGVGSGWG